MAEHVAIQAALERKRRRREEEEMTAYRRDELDQDWEFKILRSATRDFRKPQLLAKALAEEARAGWQLLEKFDNERLRLKRPLAARELDANLPGNYDPYRSQYGLGEGRLAMIIILGIFLAMGIFVAVGVSTGFLQ